MKSDFESSESASVNSDNQPQARQMRIRKNIMIIEDDDEELEDSEFN
jgi:hypothetical protein